MKPFRILAFLALAPIAISCYTHEPLNYADWYPPMDSSELVDESAGLMVMSSNVRFYSARNKASDPDKGERDWEVRKVGYFKMINTMQPDVFGVQEAEYVQLQHIKDNCSGYSYVGVGRNDGETKGESTAIFYKSNVIEVENWGTKWHSETPDQVGSFFVENEDRQPRTSTWAIFKVKATGERFFHINVHTSLYEASQAKEIQLVTEIVAEKCPEGVPVVLTGDWNVEEDDAVMKPVNDTYTSARKTASKTDNILTFHWWGSSSTMSKNQHLDHVFYSGFEKPLRFRTLNMQWEGLWISDHHPVYAIFPFKMDTPKE